jgi:hypothetical protein
MSAETTGEKQGKSGNRYKPGQSGNPRGRPKGSRHKLGENFISALQADFSEHGSEVIQAVRTKRPQDYLKIVASILPKEVNVNESALHQLSDDELSAMLYLLRSLLEAPLNNQCELPRH